MFNLNFNTKSLFIITAIVAVILLGLYGYKHAYDKGYKAGYDTGYAHALETVAVPIEVKPDTVQISTAIQSQTQTVVRPKQYKEEPAVIVKTEAPKISASVNGKKYDFEPKTQVLGTTVTTSGVINVKVPERKWTFGVGYSKDKSVGYMLKAPIKGAVGVWVAGSGKKSVMGGLSVSF